MSGLRNGVQAVFKREEPRTLYMHCLVHIVSKVCTLIQNVMDFIHDLIQLIVNQFGHHPLSYMVD